MERHESPAKKIRCLRMGFKSQDLPHSQVVCCRWLRYFLLRKKSTKQQQLHHTLNDNMKTLTFEQAFHPASVRVRRISMLSILGTHSSAKHEEISRLSSQNLSRTVLLFNSIPTKSSMQKSMLVKILSSCLMETPARRIHLLEHQARDAFISKVSSEVFWPSPWLSLPSH